MDLNEFELEREFKDIIFMNENDYKYYNYAWQAIKYNALRNGMPIDQPIEETNELLDYLGSYKVIDSREGK